MLQQAPTAYLVGKEKSSKKNPFMKYKPLLKACVRIAPRVFIRWPTTLTSQWCSDVSRMCRAAVQSAGLSALLGDLDIKSLDRIPHNAGDGMQEFHSLARTSSEGSTLGLSQVVKSCPSGNNFNKHEPATVPYSPLTSLPHWNA